MLRKNRDRIAKNIAEKIKSTADDQLTNQARLGKELDSNVEDFKKMIGKNHGVNVRSIRLSADKGTDAALLFVDGLVDNESVNSAVISPLLTNLAERVAPSDLLGVIQEKIIMNLKMEQAERWIDILDHMFCGDTILLVDRQEKALVIGTRKWIDRGVQEASSEQIILGSKDSFSETLVTNTMLLRRRIKSYKLQMEYFKLGSLTKTDVVLSYVKGIVNPKLVEEVRSRLNRIETDSIISATMIEELIEDSAFALLPQIIHTERPDRSVAHLLEGGVVLLTDGTPVALLLPIVFWQFLYSPEDYNERPFTGLLLRTLRLISFVLSLSLPSFYIAICSFHQEMIPIGLLQVIVNGRRDVPFPILLEVLIMEFILEIIREAGVRLPKNVGQAISIVGALVLGQAAIQAKLASPATVTIVALTAVSNFTIPSFSAALTVREFRFVIMLISGTFGIFGFIAIIFVALVHLCSMRSFGVPFMAPFAPLIPEDLKDSLFRLPAWTMSRRPKTFGAVDSVRQKSGLKPSPPKDRKEPAGKGDYKKGGKEGDGDHE